MHCCEVGRVSWRGDSHVSHTGTHTYRHTAYYSCTSISSTGLYRYSYDKADLARRHDTRPTSQQYSPLYHIPVDHTRSWVYGCLYYGFLLYWSDCNLPATAGTTSKAIAPPMPFLIEWITILVDLILGFIDGLLLKRGTGFRLGTKKMRRPF